MTTQGFARQEYEHARQVGQLAPGAHRSRVAQQVLAEEFGV